MNQHKVSKTPASLLGLPRLGQLTDATLFHDALEGNGCDVKTLMAYYTLMLTIRKAEERIGLAVTVGDVVCPAHLAIGQEAIAVGVSAHLTKTDRGMGGSMHLWAGGHGFAGSVPIVAGTVPLAVGAALAAKMDGGDDVAVVYLGDGAFEEGVVQESLNLASSMKLPVLFVAENNLFASHLHIDQRQPSDMLSRFAVANGIANALVDGNDVVQVSSQAQTLLDRCRSARAPGFLEAVTYRWRGHVGPREDQDVGVDRKVDLLNWKRRDPISRLAATLMTQMSVAQATLDEIAKTVDDNLAGEWASAIGDPLACGDQLLDHVYAAWPPAVVSSSLGGLL
jgi:TPP-dependent pyruvate/acetoin dehydrogenase alpha subunit